MPDYVDSSDHAERVSPELAALDVAMLATQDLADWDGANAGKRARILQAALDAVLPAARTEHATGYKSGDMQVWNEEDCVTKVYPVAERIRNQQRNGGKVWVRKVIVVEDWTEIPRG